MTAQRYQEHVGESDIGLTEAARAQLATLCEQIDDDEGGGDPDLRDRRAGARA